MILCWASLIAILGCRLDTLGRTPGTGVLRHKGELVLCMGVGWRFSEFELLMLVPVPAQALTPSS